MESKTIKGKLIEETNENIKESPRKLKNFQKKSSRIIKERGDAFILVFIDASRSVRLNLFARFD